MKKAALTFMCASVMMVGLTGCGQNQGSNANMYRGSDAQMGYDEGGYTANYPYYGTGAGGKEYYQDNRFSSKNGRMNNARANYEHSHKANQFRGMTGNHRSGMVDENGILNRRSEQGHRGMNFKKSSMNNHTKDRQAHYHRDYDGNQVQSMRSEIERWMALKGARVMMNGNDVVVGYEAEGQQNDLDHKIKNQLGESVDDGKNVIVTSERNMYSNMQKMDDRLRSGAAFKEVEDTFSDMMNDLGDAAKRPFEESH
ncbi:YhcN/YlaJ family sporulation lipoprotein [Bacillus sp. JCM 19041]|uniref:YhcN/YlaJ family sporulation lipoprotein n=1 Tax=Bacillus sp. JCM 19041 TaxID=1460637 RepID=UPI0006D28329